MVYTEMKKRNGNLYYYRVLSVRENNKIKKIRKYLGVNLSKKDLQKKEAKANKELILKSPKFNKIKDKIIATLKKYNVKKAGIFGSYIRGEETKKSDIDILVKYPKNLGGFEFAGIALELEMEIGKSVDLLTYNGLNKHLKKYILEEEVRII